LNARGLDPFIASRIESYLQSTNQVIDIHVERKSTPLGSSNGKKLGELVSISLTSHDIHDIRVLSS
jgi:hypothetical protein